METTTENSETPENTTETAPAQDTAPEASSQEEASEEAKDPTVIGNLTPEEQQLLMTMQQQKRQLFQKLGELAYGSQQIGAQISKIESATTETVNAVSTRLGVDSDTQWVATTNGEVRVVQPNPASQTNEGGAGNSA